MAQISDLENRLCVVWKPCFSYSGKPSSSSKFSFRGLQWNLEIHCDDDDDDEICSEIVLHASIPEGAVYGGLCEQFIVTTLLDLQIRGRLPYICSVETVKSAHQVLWQSEEYEHWKVFSELKRDVETKIICIFEDVRSPDLQSNGETIHLSTKGDLDLPTSLNIPPDLERLSLDLCKLLEDKAFPDVKLKCGDRTFSAHRAVLAARSEVFAAMFRNKMAENETGVVDITDLDAAVLDSLLKYLYSGKIQDLSEEAVPNLYAAGDKYSVHTLKKACSDWMIRSLNENCVNFLTMADAHSDATFKDAVVSFICSHEAVFHSEVWLQFSKKPSELAIEVYQKFVTLKRRNYNHVSKKLEWRH